jgi:16S rRNA (cytosine1402-N4)-methyltransferase
MLGEMLQALSPRPGGVYLDGTLGSGGYSEAILQESGPDGVVIGIDLDVHAIRRSRERLLVHGDRLVAVHGGFHDAGTILEELGISRIDGAVLDLGLSSEQLDDPDRGFSFRFAGPLDMRFDTDSGETLSHFLRRVPRKRLEEIVSDFGEERYFRKIARAIILARDRKQLTTVDDLAGVVSRAAGGRRGKIHPATRTFQALRIALNKEMENLSEALNEIPQLLNPGGRLCVVSYHSLEDRQVKLSFRERVRSSGHWRLVTAKPLRPSPEEVKKNPRARSARMRVLEAAG